MNAAPLHDSTGDSARTERAGERSSSARPPRIEARAMTKRFGDSTALDRVSVTIEPGSVHALLGENGAGKSTLVKCIMGFYQADSGSSSSPTLVPT